MKTLAQALTVFALTLTIAAGAQKPPQSPPAQAEVTLAGKSITVKYSSPSMRGRKIMGGLVPYGEVWRTGANPATTLVTPVDLVIGTLKVPAGTYTLFTLPAADHAWQLIVSTKTGEWGIPYPEGNDLGRTEMHSGTLAAPQESMTITFEHTVKYSTELHVRWENTDVWVHVLDLTDAPRMGGMAPASMPPPK
jgi:hypothetical protein